MTDPTSGTMVVSNGAAPELNGGSWRVAVVFVMNTSPTGRMDCIRLVQELPGSPLRCPEIYVTMSEYRRLFVDEPEIVRKARVLALGL